MSIAPVTPNGRKRRQAAIRSTIGSPLAPDGSAVRRLLDHYAAATAAAPPATVAANAAWYESAAATAAALCTFAPTHLPTTDHAAALIAALSPQTSWPANVELAYHAAELAQDGEPISDRLPHYEDCTKKAAAVLEHGEALSRSPIGSVPLQHCSAVLGGRKVRSFYANIARPLSPGPVTIDRHAIALAISSDPTYRPSGNYLAKHLERIGAYQHVAACYRAAAAAAPPLQPSTGGRAAGATHRPLPHQFQAVLWCYRRRLLDGLAPSDDF